MNTAQLGVTHGEWLEMNCGNMPSEKNCKLVMMAPSGQMDDLLDAAVAHAIKSHKHNESESDQLRADIKEVIEPITI